MEESPEWVKTKVDRMFAVMNSGVSPEFITELSPEEIFVFGSNQAGIHSKGAAKMAAMKWGAEYGISEGLTGQCYAIPTKDFYIRSLSKKRVQCSVSYFIRKAKSLPENIFLVTEVGCGLAGYDPREIGPMFDKAIDLPNVKLPISFLRAIAENLE